MNVARWPGIVAGIGLGTLAPVGLVAYADFTRPIGAEERTYGVGATVFVLVFFAPMMAVFGYLLATLRPLERFRSVAAWLAALLAASVFVVAAPRAAEVRRESILTDIPIAGVLHAGDAPITLGNFSAQLLEEPDTLACFVRITDDVGIETAPRLELEGGCQPVRVRHDAAHGIAIVETVSLWASPFFDHSWHVIASHSTRSGAEVPLDVYLLRELMRVPPVWASTAAFSSAFALVLLHAALVHRRRASKSEGLVDAVHEGDGWFALADGRRFRATFARELAFGVFGVRLLEPALPGDYRASAAATIEPVHAGTPGVVVRGARDVAGSCEGVALVVALAGSLPALVALVVTS